MTTTTRTPKASRIPLRIAIVSVVALVVLFFFLSQYYADYLWFNQLGYSEVIITQWVSMIVLFLIGFFAMAIPVWLSIEIAYRHRPVYVKLNAQLDRYREIIDPLRKLATFGIPVVVGIFAGVAAATRWTTVLSWMNAAPTEGVDAQFGLPIGFYLFQLPFWHGVVSFASAVVLLVGLAALATHVLYGGLRVNGREFSISKAARVQLAITATVYVLIQAVSLWLDQYQTLTSNSSGLLTGASYADVNATIPGKIIVASIAVLVAVLFLVAAFTGRWRLPVVGTALLLVSALVVGTLYPWLVQRFQVIPSEKTLEDEYLQRNIDATRDAYGLREVVEIPYDATTTAEAGALRQDAETTASIRLIDPALVSDAFSQIEQFRQYYQFSDLLDVGRYSIDGETQDVVIALRELNQAGLSGSGSWVNDRIVYTHGYGVVAAYGNKRTPDGQPDFLEGGIPVTGQLGDYEPRIYFGEFSPSYSIVGGPEGAAPLELDYPSGESEDAGTVRTTFDGDGGPKLENFLVQLIYAIKFQSEQLLFSSDVTEESQVLYDRHPLTRVQKAAPYLTLDSDPYPAIVDGRIVWIVDGYTTSADYPYSRTASLREAIADTYTPAPLYAVDQINYIRNSVKATVDAYDGSVTLYSWDDEDPILATWQNVFPGTVKPMSEMSGELLSHVRYPADLFKMQRAILGTYHVTSADAFYEANDAWITPNDPTSASTTNPPQQPPYYLSMQLPNSESADYTIYSTYIPDQSGNNARNVLMGYLTANSNAGSTAGTKSEDYGKLTLLTLPKDVTVEGPGQVQNRFNSDTVVANQLNLLEQGGRTRVVRGNLLTLPVGGGLLYVQPVYVRSTGETSYPLLRKVLVAFGDQIAFEDTLDVALDTLFGGDSGANAGDGDVDPGGPVEPGEGGEEPGEGGGTTVSPALRQALADATAAISEREAAMAAGDWEAYGVADAKLQAAIERALRLSQ